MKINKNPSEFKLLNPTAVWRNEQGKVTFALKIKERYGPVYYIFEKHPENLSSLNKIKFQEAWETLKLVARKKGIPLYDIEEMTLLNKRAVKKYVRETNKLPPIHPKQVDVSIPVYDHATDSIHRLRIGVSRAGLDEVKKYLKRKNL